MKSRTKAPKDEQLRGELRGELATYARDGIYQRTINPRTAYRYRGILQLYQNAIDDDTPSLELSK